MHASLKYRKLVANFPKEDYFENNYKRKDTVHEMERSLASAPCPTTYHLAATHLHHELVLRSQEEPVASVLPSGQGVAKGIAAPTDH